MVVVMVVPSYICLRLPGRCPRAGYGQQASERGTLLVVAGHSLSSGASDPDQHAAVLVRGQALAVHKLLFQIFEAVIVQVELALEGPICDPAAAPEQGNGLVENLVKS